MAVGVGFGWNEDEMNHHRVDYAERRHVRKPRGAPPGLVELQRSKTLSVRKDEARRRRLLDRDGPAAGPGTGPESPPEA